MKEDEASFDLRPEGDRVLLAVNHRQIIDSAMTLVTDAGSLRLKDELADGFQPDGPGQADGGSIRFSDDLTRLASDCFRLMIRLKVTDPGASCRPG
ncbi:MAG: hypothetical protein EHM74_05230 [Hyphomicrobiales bacterium]|nr:MAG: hypothetical protein EHM74_05230 [Hyphomicrobiales bacterium]